MKQIVFTTIFIITCCFTAFAQSFENSCQKILIDAPENIQQEEKFKVSASFEKEVQPSTSKFNWTIILGNNVSRINGKGIVEIDSTPLKDSDLIIVLAEPSDGKCQNTAMAKIFAVPHCGLPFTIDEYSKPDWNEEKARLDNVIFSMEQFKDMALFVFFEFTAQTSPIEKQSRLSKILKYLSETRGFKKDRIVFLISESERETVKFQPLPKGFGSTVFDDYLSIKGEDFDKLNNLFQIKPINKNRKNK